MAALGRSAARRRAGELPRARQPHVVEPQRAARAPASSRRGPRTTTATADLQAGPTNGSGHMNTVAVGGDMKVSDQMLVGAMFGYTDNKGDFGGPGGGYTLRQPVGTRLRGLRRRPVVRRRDARRRQPRLLRHHSRHPARRGASHRERRDARLRVHRPPPRRLLVHDAGLHARTVRATRVHEGRRQAVFRNELDSTALTYDRQDAQAAAVEPRLAGRRQHRRHSSLRARHVGDRLEGPGSQRSALRRSRWAATTRFPSRSRTTATRCSVSAPAPSSAASPGSSRVRPPRAAATATTGRSPSACGCRCSAARCRDRVARGRRSASSGLPRLPRRVREQRVVDRARQHPQHAPDDRHRPRQHVEALAGARSRATIRRAASSAPSRNGIG